MGALREMLGSETLESLERLGREISSVEKVNTELKLQRISDVGIGEEALQRAFNFDVVPNTSVEMFFGVDGGSTQTRISMLTADETELDSEELCNVALKYTIIPSAFSFVPDARHIDSKSEQVWDHMDTRVKMKLDEDPANSLTGRIVRGGCKEQANLPEVKLDSVNQKTQSGSFYLNILDGIGYAVMEKFGDKCPAVIKAFVGVALPPDDLNAKNMEVFRNNIIGRHLWSIAGKNLMIDIRHVSNITEPEAAIQGMLTLSDESVPEFVMHIEGGGRSTGVVVLKNGTTLNPTQKNFAYGGAQLLEKINEQYVVGHGGGNIRPRLWERAVVDGKLKQGNSYIDVSTEVLKAKQEIAKQIVDDIWKEVFSKQNEVTPQEINTITIGGRLFERGDLQNGAGDYLVNELKARLPYSDCTLLDRNYIPFGLLLNEVVQG